MTNDSVETASVVWLEGVGKGDVAHVGGNNASLSASVQSLDYDGVKVPGGFALTASAYRKLLWANNMAPKMASLVATKDTGGANWRFIGSSVRELILAGAFPAETSQQISSYYRGMAVRAGCRDPAVAVRRSATVEDLPDASFAGQQESYLNVRGGQQLLGACLRCCASLFADGAINYREIMKYGHLDGALSMGGQLMVRSDVGPETVQARKSRTLMSTHRLTETGRMLAEGAAVGDSIASGTACVFNSAADIGSFVDGSVLVAEQTDPDWVPVRKGAKAIVTDKGRATSHAAIVSGELGNTAVVSTTNATKVLVGGQSITVSCAEGDSGQVHEGLLASAQNDVDLGDLQETRTAVMPNPASPSAAFKRWHLPAQGIGLAGMEFVFTDMVQAHPMAMACPERVADPADLAKIKKLMRGFTEPADCFVQALAVGLAKLAAPFHPSPVVVRFSDLKTNECAHLIGGSDSEREEANPMTGFRGSSRYYDPRYRARFDLECRAVIRRRNHCGFMKVIVMVPFWRTLAEADRVLAVMAENGFVRGRDGNKIYMMCEITLNVILAQEFAAKFDGFSISSNDLSQLVLGVDGIRPLLPRCLTDATTPSSP